MSMEKSIADNMKSPTEIKPGNKTPENIDEHTAEMLKQIEEDRISAEEYKKKQKRQAVPEAAKDTLQPEKIEGKEELKTAPKKTFIR